jgi:hypothetical protein
MLSSMKRLVDVNAMVAPFLPNAFVSQHVESRAVLFAV